MSYYWVTSNRYPPLMATKHNTHTVRHFVHVLCIPCRHLLFCRVTLGKSFLQFNAMKMAHSPPGHHSVTGRPSVNGLALSEYVIYRGEQVTQVNAIDFCVLGFSTWDCLFETLIFPMFVSFLSCWTPVPAALKSRQQILLFGKSKVVLILVHTGSVPLERFVHIYPAGFVRMLKCRLQLMTLCYIISYYISGWPCISCLGHQLCDI